MSFTRIVVAALIGGVLAGVLVLAWLASKETGKSIPASLPDVPSEAQKLAAEAKSRAAEAKSRVTETAKTSLETLREKQAAVKERLGRGEGGEMAGDAVATDETAG